MTRHLLLTRDRVRAVRARRSSRAQPPDATQSAAPARRAAAGGGRIRSALSRAAALRVAGRTCVSRTLAAEWKPAISVDGLLQYQSDVPTPPPFVPGGTAVVSAAERDRRRVGATRSADRRPDHRCARSRWRRPGWRSRRRACRSALFALAPGRERRVLRGGAAPGALARAVRDPRRVRGASPRNQRCASAKAPRCQPTLRRSKPRCCSAGRTRTRCARAGAPRSSGSSNLTGRELGEERRAGRARLERGGRGGPAAERSEQPPGVRPVRAHAGSARAGAGRRGHPGSSASLGVRARRRRPSRPQLHQRRIRSSTGSSACSCTGRRGRGARPPRDARRSNLQQQIVDRRRSGVHEEPRPRDRYRQRRASIVCSARSSLDDRIVDLREQIVRTSEARFREGALTASEYVDRSTDLLEARIARAGHRVELAETSARFLTSLGLEVR